MDDVEQYSQESRSRLEEATASLVGLLQRYAVEVGGTYGGTSENPALFDRNDELVRSLVEWNERVADHTGADPLPLGYDEEDGEDLEDGDDESFDVAGQVSIVSRWDLDILDLDALLTEGRAAHRRLREEETEQDAALAIQNPGSALYAILHEKGEPLLDLPGLELVSGLRAYILPDEPLESWSGDDPDDILAALEAPAGQVPYSESWE